MRLLVLGDSLESGSRMHAAAAGLALRGHRVMWRGAETRSLGDALSRVERVGSRRSGETVDAVLGGGRAVVGAAVAGWLAGAHVMVLELANARPWSAWDRWAFDSLDSSAVMEHAQQPAAGESFHGIGAERIAAWSDAAAPATPDSAHPDVEIIERWLERALARREGHADRPAVFLDRDGTMVVEKNYLSDAAEIELLPGVARALARLKAGGYRLVVISNQAGVGRGLFTASSVYDAMARLRCDLRIEGVELDAIYFCPHAPDQGCECRKPGTKLLRDAAANLGLTLRRSFMVGDRLLDVATAHHAGAAGILVRTGYGREEAERAAGAESRPELIADDLAAAADWITAHGHAAD